jgi:hypothetical protein
MEKPRLYRETGKIKMSSAMRTVDILLHHHSKKPQWGRNDQNVETPQLSVWLIPIHPAPSLTTRLYRTLGDRITWGALKILQNNHQPPRRTRRPTANMFATASVKARKQFAEGNSSDRSI